MHPELFGVPSYTLAFAVAGVAGTFVWVRSCPYEGVRRGEVARFLAFIIVAMVLGAKLYSVIERGGLGSSAYELSNGYRYPGAMLSMLVALPFIARLNWTFSLGQVADLIAPAIPAAMAVVRVGCFLNGCCSGVTCDLPWAVRFPKGSEAWAEQVFSRTISMSEAWSHGVHPWQMYMGVACLVIAAGLLWWRPRRAYDGQLMLLYLAFHNGARVVLEFLRQRYEWHLHLMSLALFGGATAVLIVKANAAEKRA
jgi:phosphatidylglycerol:prolipoprotein diacylglycerol transferase